MRKPASLRDHLVARLPELHRDPERLLVFVDQGSLVSTFVPGTSFEYRYTLNLIATDYAADPDTLIAFLLQWVRDNQPELLANRDRHGEITFEVDVLANDKVDLSIKLPLTERTLVTLRDDGGVDTVNPVEPKVAEEWMPI